MSIESAPGAGIPARNQIPRWLNTLLIITAVVYFILSLSELPILFGDWDEAPGPGLSGKVVLLKIAFTPVLSVLAARFLIRGQLRNALFMFAAIYAVTWASWVPAFYGQDGGAQPDAFFKAQMIFELYLAPLIALAIAALALANVQRVMASLLALAPAVFHFVSFLIFFSFILVHGF
jgi:hypothetical protein